MEYEVVKGCLHITSFEGHRFIIEEDEIGELVEFIEENFVDDKVLNVDSFESEITRLIKPLFDKFPELDKWTLFDYGRHYEYNSKWSVNNDGMPHWFHESKKVKDDKDYWMEVTNCDEAIEFFEETYDIISDENILNFYGEEHQGVRTFVYVERFGENLIIKRRNEDY